MPATGYNKKILFLYVENDDVLRRSVPMCYLWNLLAIGFFQ